MKIGICNLNGTTIKKGTNINSEEVINLCNGINNTTDNVCTVFNYSKVQPDFNNISIYDANFDINSFDKIIIMGSMANFFGGVKDDDVINIYKVLAKYNRGNLYYIFNDFRLPFRQLWKNIANRDWNDCAKEDVFITAPIVILSQFRDLKDALKANTYDGNNIADVVFFDFAKWILHTDACKYIDNTGEYDLIYGGSFRAGNRVKKFTEYFVNRDSNIAIYGSMSARNFKDIPEEQLPEFLGRVDSEKCIEMNSKGFSTLIVGEKHYNNSTITLRVYESILANCVVFIDTEFDEKHYLNLHPFMYIKSGKELDDKIEFLRSNKEAYDTVISHQKDFINECKSYNVVNELIKLIGG